MVLFPWGNGVVHYAWLCMADDPWLPRSCQSNSDQGYLSKIVTVTVELSDEP